MIPTESPEDLGRESSHYQGLGRNSPPRSVACSQLPHNPGLSKMSPSGALCSLRASVACFPVLFGLSVAHLSEEIFAKVG